MAKRHFVTFAIPEEKANAVITEYLRYAGIISVTGKGHTGRLPFRMEQQFPPGSVLVTMECPKGLTAVVWANQNIERLKSFGVKAEYWTERV